jgi:hypothetical protein
MGVIVVVTILDKGTERVVFRSPFRADCCRFIHRFAFTASGALIEGHLAYFIARRELDISEFLTKGQVDEIAGFFEARNTESIAERKHILESGFCMGSCGWC